MISLLIVVPEILDVLTGHVGRSVPVANKVTLPSYPQLRAVRQWTSTTLPTFLTL